MLSTETGHPKIGAKAEMIEFVSFSGVVQQFPGVGGWVYVSVPQIYTKKLRARRGAWGAYPITAHVGHTSWKTKLMVQKGGDFFVAIKRDIRRKENIRIGTEISISFDIAP